MDDTKLANLRDHKIFPPFSHLPDEKDIDLEFYNTLDGFRYVPTKHWCFLAEITDVEHFIRVRLLVRDKAGRELPVAFYTDGRGGEFARSQLRAGNTVAILYAQQHGFLDLTVGIRLEEESAIKVYTSLLT